MDVELTRLETFHSHLEGLWRLNPNDLKHQVFHICYVRWSCVLERIEIHPHFVQLTSVYLNILYIHNTPVVLDILLMLSFLYIHV